MNVNQTGIIATAMGDCDLVMQFRPVVVNDILTRQLHDPLALTAQAQKLAQRYLTLEAVLPSVISFGDPTIACADHDQLLASVPISGGIRPPVLNHNVTLSANVQMPLKTVFSTDASGAPYITAEITSASALRLADLELGLASLHVPVGQIDLSQVTEPLRPFLAENLLQSLARLSYTYSVGSLPVRFPAPRRPDSSTATTITDAQVRVFTDSGAEALALAISLSGAPGVPGQISTAFTSGATGNMALLVSPHGLGALLEYARTQGYLQGTLRRANGGSTVPWSWKQLQCVPGADGLLTIRGLLLSQQQELAVDAAVACAITLEGLLTLTPAGPLDEVVHAAISGALQRALGIGEREDGRLHQTFGIAHSHVSVETTATSLQMDASGIRLVYDVPLFKDRSIPLPTRKPEVTIMQQSPVPVASGPGTPVTARLQARVVKQSFPPYDIAWTTDSEPLPPTEGSERQVVGTALNAMTGVHTLTTAHVRVTDLFGQVATASLAVQYRVRQRRHWGRRLAIAVLAVLVVLVGIAFLHPFPTPPTPPSAPMISITAPADNSTVTVGARFTLATSAADGSGNTLPDSAISWTATSGANQYTLGHGNTLITSIPQPGTYTIEASATSDGLVTNATPIRLVVVPPPPPMVQILSPTNGQEFVMSQGGSVTITLSSSASAGVVSYSWTDSDNLIHDTLSNDMVTIQQAQVGCVPESDTITLTVTDSFNQTATSSTPIMLIPECIG